uniref:non-specific serine/threonine protein kinase n=1 Tax=Globodera pallida TaxID=36090 RepID=A0A183CIF1_GLOPA
MDLHYECSSPKICLGFQYFGQPPKADAEKEDKPKEDETTAADDKEEKREDEMSPLCSIYDFKGVRGIAAGASASVFYGEEMVSLVPASNRNVALKRINLTKIDMDSLSDQYAKNEVNILKALNHPNIVKCFYSFEELSRFSGVKYLVLVLEYINGGDLETWLKVLWEDHRFLVPEADIWRMFTQIADAVSFIHKQQAHHSPRLEAAQRALLTKEDTVKLADFGLACNRMRRVARKPSGCGTPYYMSPERILEETYTTKSDIWSLGCILYEVSE